MGLIDDIRGSAKSGISAWKDSYSGTGAYLNLLSMGAHGTFMNYIGHTKYWRDKLFPKLTASQEIAGNKQSNTAKRPVIYGARGKVGGNQDFIHTSADGVYLWVLLDICEGPIAGIDEVYIDDVISTDPKFSGLVTIYKHLGAADQPAPAELVTAFPSYFTETYHRLRGAAYVVCRFKFSPDVYQGFPAITCNVRGRTVYDPRTDSVGYSTTPALCVRDYATNPLYGRGLSPVLLNDDYISAAADYHETQVVKHSGTFDTFDLLECNAFLDTERTVLENLKVLLAASRAGFPKINGKYCLLVEKDYPVSFSFDENSIVGAWSFTGGDVSSRLNEIEIKYVNRDLGWKDDICPVTSPALFAQDGNQTLSASISADYIVDKYHADDLADLEIKRSRQQIACSFLATPAALSAPVGSIVDVTHPSPGWDHKKFRVIECNLLPNALVGVSLIEHEPATYDRNVPVEYTPPADTNLPSPNNVLPPGDPVLTSGDECLLVASDGTVVSRIRAAWAPPSGYPYATGYDIEYQKDGDSDWISGPTIMASSGTYGFVGPVDDGKMYHVRVRTVGPNNRRSTWSTKYGHVVLGKLSPPGDVTTFLVERQADGTRQFDWTMDNPPPDLAGYQIRYKLSSDQAWEDLAPLHDGILVSSPYETNLLAAGTYTVGIVAVDTSGNISENPLLINSTLGDPRIKSAVYTTDVGRVSPIWPGIKTDCFVDIHNGVILASSTKTWDDFAIDGIDWSEWTGWNRSPASPFSYEHPAIDLGAVLSFTPLVNVSGTGSFVVEECHSNDDITYTSWAVPSGVLTTRYIKVRCTVTSSPTPGTLDSMRIVLSADPVEEFINDLDTSTISFPAGTFVVPLSKTFSTITQVQVAIQGTGGGWTWRLVDKSPTGPTVNIYNGSVPPVLADAIVDIYVRGV